MPVTTTTGEGWQADLDYRLMQIAAELTQLAQGSPGVAVDHLTVAPTSLTLTINTVPTTVAVDHVTVAPTSVTLTPPTQVTLGTAITHAGFGRTYFGAQPDDANLQWAEASPFRFGWTMSGASSRIKPLFPKAYCSPYALHHFTEATGQEPSDNATASWGTLALTWAQANGQNVEDLFLHAAVGQPTNSAIIATITTAGLISLGIQTSNNKQQLSQARAGIAASNAFQIGGTYTLTNLQPSGGGALITTTVTVTDIPSPTQIQTSYTGPAATGGTIARIGDGTKTFANRIFYESETDWAWVTNPGSAAAQNFQVFRVGQIMSDTDTGVFWDSHSASNMRWPSVEYGLSGGQSQYVTDICTLFGLYRSTYPGTTYFPNIANATTALDAQMADAAGGCQQEGALNIFRAGRPNDSVGQFTVARLAKGTIVEIGGTPAMNGAEPHAGVSGLTTAQRAGGAHNYTTVDDRFAMTVYAAYLLMVDQRSAAQIAAGALKHLFLDPAGQFFSVFPLSARWETAWEHALGEPTAAFPPLTLWQSGTDAAGGQASVYTRVFTDTGSETGTPTGIVFMRVQGGNTTAYDGTTAFAVPIPVDAPTGKTWAIMDDTGAVTGSFNLGDPIPLWNVDSVILVPN